MASPRPPLGLNTVHATESLPPGFTASLFLCGGGTSTDATGAAPPWQEEALRLLAERGYSGIVLLPEPREKGTAISPDRLSRWEDEALRHCDLILMWLPAEALSDFAAIQRWGLLQRSGKLILGTPMHDGPLCQTAERLRIPLAHSLEALMTLGQQLCRPGVYRRGGERSVPLSLWRSPSFQSWLSALVHAGHRLDGIDLEWTHRARGIGRPPFLWAIRPRVQLSGERGLQNGEVVIGRADISATVLYHRSKATPLLATQVVLVREFRAAVRNHGGYAWMLPGGSAARASERHHDARATAAQEIREETGLELASDLLEPVPLGDRQLLASLSSHHGHLFRAALSNAQLATLLQTASAGRPLGATPSERCYVSVRRLEELLAEPDLDWSQLGMVLYALYDLQER